MRRLTLADGRVETIEAGTVWCGPCEHLDHPISKPHCKLFDVAIERAAPVNGRDSNGRIRCNACLYAERAIVVSRDALKGGGAMPDVTRLRTADQLRAVVYVLEATIATLHDDGEGWSTSQHLHNDPVPPDGRPACAAYCYELAAELQQQLDQARAECARCGVVPWDLEGSAG